MMSESIQTMETESTIPSKLLSYSSSSLNAAAPYITRKRSVSDFQFLECIGEGSYSKVYRAVSKKNVHTYAIKVLNKQHIHKEKKRKYVTIEKNTLNVLGKHPGIVTLYYTFQDPKSLYFVIDYAQNGELLNLIHKLGSLSLELSHYYTIQLIDAITFIHSKKIIHRDLKPENILLNNDWKLMITDFGAAKFISNEEIFNDDIKSNENDTGLSDSLGSFVGTAEYISPELLKYNKSSFASDFWSLGCILYQMLIGKPPFKASNEYETFERIVDLNYSFPDPSKYPIPSQVRTLIESLLVEDPNGRLNSESIKTQPWFINVNWNDKSKIWGVVPKLEPYDPDKYFKNPATSKISSYSSNNLSLPKNKYVSHKRIDVDYINDKPGTVLKKQIINAQGNNQLMNKVLNNRIDEKSKIITNTINKDPLSALQVNKKRAIKTPITSPRLTNESKMSPKTPIQVPNKNKYRRSSQNSLSSVSTTNDSSKSVIIKSKNTNTPTIPELSTFSSNDSVKIDKRSISDKIIPQKNVPNIAKPKLQNSKLKNSISTPTLFTSSNNNTTQNTATKVSTSPNLAYNQTFLPKPRVPSHDAAAAAGAIGTLLTHNRHINSTSSTKHQYKQLLNHQKQMINPVLLDRQIPSIITSKLLQHETILKLDNIFKSEVSHKPNQFKLSGETLNHSILENIIHKYDRDLEKHLKSCIMVVTSCARIFIYELNDNFKLCTPQSAIQMQAQAFYSKIIEIKLTNKNVSLYDYEFDEEMHEGYLILELSNVNKLIFLSAWDRSRLVKGGINSNVRVGFNVNEDESWVKSFLRAKNILKRREMILQNSKLGIKNDKKSTNKDQEMKIGLSISGSTASMQQSFRKLKINTKKIRSFSSSKENQQQSPFYVSHSMKSITSPIIDDMIVCNNNINNGQQAEFKIMNNNKEMINLQNNNATEIIPNTQMQISHFKVQSKLNTKNHSYNNNSNKNNNNSRNVVNGNGAVSNSNVDMFLSSKINGGSKAAIAAAVASSRKQ
jgi:protein-serine/threonine kinase